jgi:hypothetical protein
MSGDYISFVNAQTQTEEGRKQRYTFSGGVYFERMRKLRLYSTNAAEIKERVNKAGVTGIFAEELN